MRKRAVAAMLVSGIGFSALSVLLLLWNLGGPEVFTVSWPSVPLALGLILVLYSLYRPRRFRAVGLFVGMMASLAGAITLLARALWPPAWGFWLSRLWPLYVGALGLSLVPVALVYRNRRRFSFLIPAWVLMVLSFLFLLFSLEWVEGGLASFTARWWPVVLLLLGGILILASWYQRSTGGNSREESHHS